MIEVDLRPDREKQKGGGLLSDLDLETPDWASLGELASDPWTVALAAAGLIFALGVAWTWISQEGRAEELDRRLEGALADSTRLAELRSLSDSLVARQEDVQRRLRLVKDLDRNRYVWPHLMNEIARALPEVVWLEAVQRTSPLPGLSVSIRGVAANPLAITAYVRNLRDEPHIGSATIQGSSRQQVRGVTAQSFSLLVTYTRPPEAQVRTRPLVTTTGGG